LSRKIQALEKGISGASNTLNFFGIVILFILMLQGAADVISRYVFNKPILGTMERSEVLLALMVFLAWGYVQFKRAHVDVKFFIYRLSHRIRVLVYLITNLLILVLFSLIMWQSFMMAKVYHEAGRLIYVIHWPLAPFALIVCLGALIVCLVLIMQIVELCLQMRGAN
jgi:TRAP-type C4-dicarboxylate transport system permease small subunit